MTRFFRGLMVLVGFLFAGAVFAGDNAVASSSSSSGAVADTSVGAVGYGFVAESISKTESVFWKCGAPTVKVIRLVYMTHNNELEVNDMETDINLALMSQGYRLYKRPCPRGRQAQARIVRITIE